MSLSLQGSWYHLPRSVYFGFKMALSSSIITGAIISAGANMTGPSFPLLAQALGNGIYSWAIVPANLLLAGVVSGAQGVGVVTGKLSIVPNPPLVLAGLSSSGVIGPTASQLASAVGTGVANAFTSSAQYTGPAVGVAGGADVSGVIVANLATLTPILLSSMAGTFGQLGVSSSQVAQGLSTGISSLIQTAVGTGAVTGTPTSPTVVAGTTPSSTVF
jgi:hypothetical protein